ncbi:MAG TPA: UDP-N-acetylmuramoyl-L-alanyl-D-glutamate--2,6-diaminopimelate ligase, partial [Longimicrobiales bacterium]|nr:UDP-N-acetylmuramoyl-L-alanyl-D-glutamate--2,6-diaminopimelate ligase [Longimicrobiales bacterium]
TVYGDPASELRLVGITGTNGKTTTAGILRHVLAGRWTSASIGTLGVLRADGTPALESGGLTTPGPVEMARVLRRLVDQGVEAVTLEASSHALHQGRLHSARFDVAVFTNVSRDHLDYHETLEAYVQAKEILADLLRPGGVAVVNADDPAWGGVRTRAVPTLLFTLDDAVSADVRARDLELTAAGSRFRLVGPGGEAAVELPLLGAFNVQNALGAAAAALALGMETAQVAERLARAPQVPGRLERITTEPCPVLRDYAHTPDALERVLSTLSTLVDGRLIVVFGAGGDRDPGKRPLMGAVAERWADVVIVTSDNPRTEDPEAIIDDIVAGMSGGAFMRETDRRAAIARALGVASANDLVLLAGKGHETYQVLGTDKVSFDEKVVVAELLGRGAALNGRSA